MKKLMLMATLALPVAAFAHAHLESSVPGKGSTVKTSPGKVELVFNEPVGLTALMLQKKGEKTAHDLVPLPKDDSVYLAVPLAKLADGEYVLTYAGLSSDQHESKGTIEFKVSATEKPSAGGMAGKKMDCCKEMMEHMHGGAEAGHAGPDQAKPAAAAPTDPAASAEHDHSHADAPK
ncbi:MAG: copper resistance protein CopC [Gammaproteobacteria bacterium]|nr:copper resistance protein CopC [Gammaproteobacteria bacterium]